MFFDPSDVATAEPPGVRSRRREEIPDRFKWNLTDIFPDWEAWEAAYKQLEADIATYAALKGTLAGGPDKLLEAFRLSEELGQLAYRVWYFPSLQYDEDQRDNTINAKRQQVQILFARLQQAESWFNPELLTIPLETVRGWMEQSEPLRRLPVRHREPVSAAGARARRGRRAADVAGEPAGLVAERGLLGALDGRREVSDDHAVDGRGGHGLVRPVPRAPRDAPRAGATARPPSARCTRPIRSTLNTYATLYNAVCQRDWFQARARGYRSTLEAALHGDNIPTSVVENLIETTRAGVEPLRRYHRLRRKTLGVPSYQVYDFSIPLVTFDKKYQYDDVLDWIVAAVAPLGPEYQARMREGFAGRWIDVYENEGKRSGAYSAPVYGTHPYMLLNYTDTLDDVFTLAHEMGHSMHTILSHETQPFVYSSYTIFVAEVPSTLSEALLLEYMLDALDRPGRAHRPAPARDRQHHRHVLHAGDVRRLRAARAPARRAGPADHVGDPDRDVHDAAEGLLRRRARPEPADGHHVGAHPALLQLAVLRLPVRHLLRVGGAAGARDHARQRSGPDEARERYLTLLKSGGNDYPMEQLKKAGVDLAQPDTVRAVIEQLDDLVTRLEKETGELIARRSTAALVSTAAPTSASARRPVPRSPRRTPAASRCPTPARSCGRDFRARPRRPARVPVRAGPRTC